LGKFYNFKGFTLSKYRIVSAAFTAFSAVGTRLNFCGKGNDGNNQFQLPYFNLDAPYLFL